MTDSNEIRWSLFGSHELAKAIAAFAPRLSDAEVREVLTEEWTRCEAHAPYRAVLIGLFRRAGFITDRESEFVMNDELTIYRGNAGEAEPVGISWTLSREIADRFSLWCFTPRAAFLGILPNFEEARPTVWVATVKRADVLAYFDSRHENEVIVDPATLFNVERVWTGSKAEIRRAWGGR